MTLAAHLPLEPRSSSPSEVTEGDSTESEGVSSSSVSIQGNDLMTRPLSRTYWVSRSERVRALNSRRSSSYSQMVYGAGRCLEFLASL